MAGGSLANSRLLASRYAPLSLQRWPWQLRGGEIISVFRWQQFALPGMCPRLAELCFSSPEDILTYKASLVQNFVAVLARPSPGCHAEGPTA